MKTLRRRRQEFKTDYGKRIKLLKGEKPRLVFRRTNRYLLAQYVVSKEAKDKALFGMNTKSLLKYGWPKEASSSIKSTPAAYLLGYLIGKQIILKKAETPVIDFGMIKLEHKGKAYAFIQGVIESGVKVKCSEEFFPDESRIKGEHLKIKVKLEEIKKKIDGGVK